MSFLSFPAAAHAGILEFFFPTLADQEPSPMETLRAPFAEDANLEGPEPPAADKGLPVNAVPLNQPHRSAENITDWMRHLIPEVMTIAGADSKAALEESADLFDAAGRQQYLGFLEEKGLMRVLQSGKYEIRSFVQDAPLLLNEGEVGGTYHWLYEIPVMVTYLEKGTTNYKGVQPVSQKMVLNVQVGRSATAKNSEGLLIEQWAGRVQKLDKK